MKDQPMNAQPTEVPPFEPGYGNPVLSDLYALLGALDHDIITPWGTRQYLARIINQMQEGPKHMAEYEWKNTGDPQFYENQTHQHSTDTATTWALHLHLPPGTKAEREASRDKILERVSRAPGATGYFCFEDSWEEWGEEIKGDDDSHMVVYYNASPADAQGVGARLAAFAASGLNDPEGIALVSDYGISTSGDYAEQLDHPDHKEKP